MRNRHLCILIASAALGGFPYQKIICLGTVTVTPLAWGLAFARGGTTSNARLT
jgi:hypothetical protein